MVSEIRIDKIENGYTTYISGIGTTYFDTKDKVIEYIKEKLD